MRPGRLLAIVAAALAGGCLLPFLLPMRSGLAASVEGVVGKADIHEIADDHYLAHPEMFWPEEMLHVRLSTSRDLVSFSHRKHLRMDLQWRFCDDGRQEVSLGGVEAFVNGVSVWERSSKPSPARDGTGRFVYDAILYVRDSGTEKGERYGSVVFEAFDLAREPRDVCVAVWLVTKPGGYRTKPARIPKEDIAAALGVEVPSVSPAEGGATTSR